jgi:hypothetical protein
MDLALAESNTEHFLYNNSLVIFQGTITIKIDLDSKYSFHDLNLKLCLIFLRFAFFSMIDCIYAKKQKRRNIVDDAHTNVMDFSLKDDLSFSTQ